MNQHIERTREYDGFKTMTGNRRKIDSHVNRLAASFQEHPHLIDAVPIVVNDKGEICDGRHRFEALKKLGEEIPYMVVPGLTIDDVQIINSGSKTWSPRDYAESFVERNGPRGKHYKLYLDFRSMYGLTHEIAVAFLSLEKPCVLNEFRNGKFKVEDEALSHKLCQQLNEIQEFHKRGDSKKFAFAVKELLIHPDYDHDRMMGKVRTFGDRFFHDAATTADYMRQLEHIYNYHVKAPAKQIKIYSY